MSEMDYSDDGSDGTYSSDDGNGSDAFEAPPVVAQESRYHVFSPEECLRQAEAKVKDVCELLCCQPDVAHLLLRHFRWDHDKLTDGERSRRVLARARPAQLRPALCCGLPSASPAICGLLSAAAPEPCGGTCSLRCANLPALASAAQASLYACGGTTESLFPPCTLARPPHASAAPPRARSLHERP